MIPETIVMTIAAFQLGGVLDFRNENITRMIIKKEEGGTPALKWVCGLAILAALVYDVAAVFSHLQNAESGDFDITGLALVNWTSVAAVTIAAVAVVLVLVFLFGKHDKKAAPQA